MSDHEIYVRLLNRDFTINRFALNVTLTVNRFSVASLGGYDTAEIELSGSEEGMFALTDMLRCGIELYDSAGQTVWQGVIWSVQLPWGRRIIGRSLELAANTVQVAYNKPEGGVGRTAWGVNAQHLARYGTKELVGNLTDSTDAQALVYRDTLLKQRAIWPAPKTVSRESSSRNVTGKLICVGLYKTLDWRYYTNPEFGLSRFVDSNTSKVPDAVWVDHYEGPAYIEDLTIQFGDAAASSQAYFWLTCNSAEPVTLTKVEFKLVKIGAPADTLFVDLVLDNAGVPGTVLQSTSVPAASLNTAHDWMAFQFKFILLPGIKYGFVLRRTGALDAVNFFRSASHSSLGYGNGVTRVYNAGVWTTATSDIFFKLDAKSKPIIDIGAVTARTRLAQKFTMDAATSNYGVVAVKISAAKVGVPPDDLLVQIWTDTGTAPGTLVGQVNLSGAAMSIAPKDISVTFGVNNAVAVAPGTARWLVVQRSGAIDPLNYYTVGADFTTPVFTIDVKHWNGTAYVPLSGFKWMPYGITYGLDSMEQLRRIALAAGQFFTSVDIRLLTGVFVPAYGSGDFTALTLINELLQIGGANGTRLNARVTNDRWLQVFTERALDATAWYEAEDGVIRTNGGSEVPDDMTVGVWVQPQNLPGGEIPLDWAHFIERAEWSNGVITRTSRDTRDAFDVFGVQER